MAVLPEQPLLLGLSVALGAGLLIGLERERRKGRGPHRAAAGIRSFTLVALSGALAQGLGQPALVALGALAVIVLAALAYAYSLRPAPGRRQVAAAGQAGPAEQNPPATDEDVPPGTPDPGMTTELALLVTYLVGVLAVAEPALGAGAGAVVAVLLAARGRLHRFATQLLSEDELHDGLLLAGLALVLVPLVPQGPVPWLAGLQPHQLAVLVLLILVLQAAGHVALRLAGPGLGLALSGLFSGFVSSAATIASLGRRAVAQPRHRVACQAGAMLSTAATWLQASLMLAAIAPALAGRLLPALLAGAAVALAAGGWQARRARRQEGVAHDGAGAAGRALRVREALLVALLLTAVTWAVAAASQWLGDRGALAGAALAGLGDAHSGVAALGALAHQQRLAVDLAAGGVLATVATNSLTRSTVALVTGGRAYAAPIIACLVVSLAAAVGAGLLAGVFGGA